MVNNGESISHITSQFEQLALAKAVYNGNIQFDHGVKSRNRLALPSTMINGTYGLARYYLHRDMGLKEWTGCYGV